jgi:putative transcriptional regulator
VGKVIGFVVLSVTVGGKMKDDLFAELMESAAEALDHARGKRELRTSTLPDPPEPMNPIEVRRLRERLSASQAVFAHCLNVSTKLVQAWEGHRRTPDGAALRLLRLAENCPALLFSDVSALYTRGSAKTTRGGRAVGESTKIRRADSESRGRSRRKVSSVTRRKPPR